MRNDQIFVLLLVILLPMSGCFDGAVGDAEGTDDASSGTTVINNYYNNSTNSQERIWYSTGDIVNTTWSDGQDYSSGSMRCLEFGPSYDSETGAYLGEECKEMGYPSSSADWNSSECSGELLQGSSGGALGGSDWRYGPQCKMVANTITTNSGEALILYEMQHITITTTCGGVQSSTVTSINSASHYGSGGEEYRIIPGSAMNCSHEISYTQGYAHLSSTTYGGEKILSLIYAIQDTVVV
jgi:hypothetical protein